MLKGRVHKYGANVDTDAIIPARYLNVSDPLQLAQHCMEDIDLRFAQKAQPGDIIVATQNFGCGSSREHAPVAIKAIGVSCVIADTFARIFFRNAINIGLPLLECPQAVTEAQSGDIIAVDLDKGIIVNESRHQSYTAKPYPAFMSAIIKRGGLVAYTKAKLESVGKPEEA